GCARGTIVGAFVRWSAQQRRCAPLVDDVTGALSAGAAAAPGRLISRPRPRREEGRSIRRARSFRIRSLLLAGVMLATTTGLTAPAAAQDATDAPAVATESTANVTRLFGPSRYETAVAISDRKSTRLNSSHVKISYA